MRLATALGPGICLDILKEDNRFERSLMRSLEALAAKAQTQMISLVLDILEAKSMSSPPETLAILHYFLGTQDFINLLALFCNPVLEPCLRDMLLGQAVLHVQTTHPVSSLIQSPNRQISMLFKGRRKPYGQQ
jgi:hypothetical protein